MTFIVPSRPARPIRVDGGGRIPAGGTTGQALVKSADADYATTWATVSGGGGVTDGDKGDITVSGSGATWTIAAGAVTVSKMANLAASTILGNNTGVSAAPIALSVAQVKTLLAIAAGDVSGLATVATSGSAADLSTGTLPAGRMPAHTGDVTSSAGSVALTIASGAVTLAKQANMATASLVYRKTAGTGAPEVNTLATLKADLGLTGTNSGDQTITLTSDVTGSGTGSFATTLATVNANVGAFGSATQVGTFTVNAKGLTTAAGSTAIAIPSTQVTDFGSASRAALNDYDTTATSASPITLTASSKDVQVFTGSASQTVNLPVVSTLTLGRTFRVRNTSTGVVTVQSSGGTLVGSTVSSNMDATFTVIALTGTDDTPWLSRIESARSRTGSGAGVFASSPTFNGTPIFGAATTSGASLRLPHGTAPTTPVDGDMWTTTAGTYVRINGATVGPLGTGGVTDGDKGDITVSGSGATWTIDAGAVTVSKMADLAASTILGNNTGGAAAPIALSAAQATALLDTFTSGAKGLAPASGGGTTNFLRADGTWAAPSGGGGGGAPQILSWVI